MRGNHSIIITLCDYTLKNGIFFYPFSNPHHFKMYQSTQWLFYISYMGYFSYIHSFLFYYSLILFHCRWKQNCLGFFSRWKKPQNGNGILSLFPQQQGHKEKAQHKGIKRKQKLQITEFKKINWWGFSFVQSLYITQSEWHCSVT